jgi:hypothetical protein
MLRIIFYISVVENHILYVVVAVLKQGDWSNYAVDWRDAANIV